MTVVYQERMILLMKTHLNGKNLFLAVNTWAISVIKYSAVGFYILSQM